MDKFTVVDAQGAILTEGMLAYLYSQMDPCGDWEWYPERKPVAVRCSPWTRTFEEASIPQTVFIAVFDGNGNPKEYGPAMFRLRLYLDYLLAPGVIDFLNRDGAIIGRVKNIGCQSYQSINFPELP